MEKSLFYTKKCLENKYFAQVGLFLYITCSKFIDTLVKLIDRFYVI